VTEHEDWYKRLLQVTERKRIAIKKWRTEKEKEKIDSYESEQNDKMKKMEEYEQEKQKQLHDYRKQSKQRLEAWKEVKAKDAEKEEEEQQRREEDQKRKREWDILVRKQETQQALKEYKEEKKKQEHEAYIAQQAQQQQMKQEQIRSVSPSDIQRRWQRDAEYAQRMAEYRNRATVIEQEKEERLKKIASKVKIHVERDFSRVLQPTSAQRNREKELRVEGPDNKSRAHNFDIRHVQHRVTPGWMK
jgi:hypothetical protein